MKTEIKADGIDDTAQRENSLQLGSPAIHGSIGIASWNSLFESTQINMNIQYWIIAFALALCAPRELCLSLARAESLTIAETDAIIAISHGQKTVLVYNKTSPPVPEGIDPVYHRSGFLHPVKTPMEKTITEAFPKDHPHQHGIFFAWVKTTYGDRSVDFWNLAGRTGRVVHERVVHISQGTASVEFEVDLIHRAENPSVDILRERWKVTVHEPAKDYYCFDLESIQQALTDTPLVVEKYHYGGMAFRGISKWLTKADQDRKGGESIQFEPNSFLNNSGQDRKLGNHTPSTWVALTGTIEQQNACIAVLSHAKNFRAPQPARLHDSKPYFCYSPCVTDSFEISKAKPLYSKYRFLVIDAPANSDWIESNWIAMNE